MPDGECTGLAVFDGMCPFDLHLSQKFWSLAHRGVQCRWNWKHCWQSVCRWSLQRVPTLVQRGDKILIKTKIKQLQNFKAEVHAIDDGSECGVGLLDFEDFQRDDVIECCVEQLTRQFLVRCFAPHHPHDSSLVSPQNWWSTDIPSTNLHGCLASSSHECRDDSAGAGESSKTWFCILDQQPAQLICIDLSLKCVHVHVQRCKWAGTRELKRHAEFC